MGRVSAAIIPLSTWTGGIFRNSRQVWQNTSLQLHPSVELLFLVSPLFPQPSTYLSGWVIYVGSPCTRDSLHMGLACFNKPIHSSPFLPATLRSLRCEQSPGASGAPHTGTEWQRPTAMLQNNAAHEQMSHRVKHIVSKFYLLHVHIQFGVQGNGLIHFGTILPSHQASRLTSWKNHTLQGC